MEENWTLSPSETKIEEGQDKSSSELAEHVRVTYAFLNQHEFEKALIYLDEQIQKDNGCRPYLFALKSLVLCTKGDNKEALELAEKAVQLDPTFAFHHYVRARVLDNLRLFHEAIISISEAIRIAPQDPVYHLEMVLIYFQQERWVEAISAANRGLEHVPGDIQLLELRRAALSMLEKERGYTHTVIGDTLQRIIFNADISADRGWVEFCNRNYNEAFKYFTEALLLNPNHPKAQKGIIALMRRMEKKGSSLFYLISEFRKHQREGILTATLFLLSATCHVIYAETFPLGVLWYLPGLLLLILSLSAPYLVSTFLHFLRRQWSNQSLLSQSPS